MAETEAATNTLKRIPMPVWILVVVGGIGASLYLSNRSKAATTNQPSPPMPVGSRGADPTGVTPNSGTTTPTKPQTNEQWARAAYDYALAMNYPADLVDSAIRGYLAGIELTPNQNAIIKTVMQGIGAPPQVLPPTSAPPTSAPQTGGEAPGQPIPVPLAPPIDNIPNAPPPPPPPTPPFPQGTVWSVDPGDTLWHISSVSYASGNNGPGDWALIQSGVTAIYNANSDQITNPNLIYPGQQLYIPILGRDF